jgi:hypothetical protein
MAASSALAAAEKELEMRTLGLCALVMLLASCGDDDDAPAADRLGVGAECSSDSDCLREGDGGINLACLDQFKGGYCGVEDCTDDGDCPEQSACVAHDDGSNYCFRICATKPECNANRQPDDESNCSSNVDFVDDANGKACVPPSA